MTQETVAALSEIKDELGETQEIDECKADMAEDRPPEAEVDLAMCAACDAVAEHECVSCQIPLCDACSYHEEGGTKFYCRACADEIVGVCDECDALYAKPCRTCGKKVCDACRKSVIERWGWGGVGGQGGFTTWFPVVRTYCQEHGQHQLDAVKPTRRTFKGYDGSSPEW